jgi:hypothetical protein
VGAWLYSWFVFCKFTTFTATRFHNSDSADQNEFVGETQFGADILTIESGEIGVAEISEHHAGTILDIGSGVSGC